MKSTWSNHFKKDSSNLLQHLHLTIATNCVQSLSGLKSFCSQSNSSQPPSRIFPATLMSFNGYLSPLFTQEDLILTFPFGKIKNSFPLIFVAVKVFMGLKIIISQISFPQCGHFFLGFTSSISITLP